MPPIIQIRDLKKQYNPPDGPWAVADVDLEIEAGEVFSLLGPNGAGKTTTISMLSGLLTPSGGVALIDGHDITREPLAVKQIIGVVPQEIALYPRLSARQNLRYFGQLYGLGGKALNQAIDEVLEFIDLKDRADEKIEKYSGGMKRRVNIGVGLLHKPKIVFMDEPTVGIDPQSRRRILDTVVQLKNEFHMTVIYTTHYMEEAQELSDRVGIIDHGEVIAVGTTGELIQLVGEQDSLRLRVERPGNPVRRHGGLRPHRRRDRSHPPEWGPGRHRRAWPPRPAGPDHGRQPRGRGGPLRGRARAGPGSRVPAPHRPRAAGVMPCYAKS